MDDRLLSLLCCPVTRSPLQLRTITVMERTAGPTGRTIVTEGILFAGEDWFYPVRNGIPRLNVEAYSDHADFLRLHMNDYSARREQLEKKYPGLIAYVKKKNRRTKESFSLEWSLHNYEKDRTWTTERTQLLDRFLQETDETISRLDGKLIFDAGCGNGQLDTFIAGQGATVVAMDLSNSIERAYSQNNHPNALFIQGDLQFPPLREGLFDIVQCSGVLHHTNNTELSFSCLASCVRPGGTFSIWLYHPRSNALHNLFNFLRSFTSRLPARWCYALLFCTALPVSYAGRKIKGSPQNRREIMIALMDWFSPEFRREHSPDETRSWYVKRGYHSVKVTVNDLFGFNMIGKR